MPFVFKRVPGSVKEATPLTNVPVPKGMPPSEKVTVPVGIPVIAVTVAEKVTAVFMAEELLLEVMTVVVAKVLLTVWVKMGDVAVMKLASPL